MTAAAAVELRRLVPPVQDVRMTIVTYGDVKAAVPRLSGVVRPTTVAAAGRLGPAEVFLALEFMQYTGSFKARAATNVMAALLEQGGMPEAGITMATGANADLAYAWAAVRHGVPVTVFLSQTAPRPKVARLRGLGAEVRLVRPDQATAYAAAGAFAERTGAIDGYRYADLAAAGSGTLLLEIAAAVPGLDTVIVAVGSGGMFAGITAAANHYGIRVVGAEPDGCRALNAAIEAGAVVDVPVNSIAADSLGAFHVSQAALTWAQTADVRSVVVGDPAIVAARRRLWEDHRLVVEHGSATAFAALTSGAYVPRDLEKIAVVLCGANTDPADLAEPPAAAGALPEP